MLLCMYWRNICIQFVNKKYTDQCTSIQKKGQASAKHRSPCLSHCLSSSPARALSLSLVHGNCMKFTHFAKKKQLIFLLCNSFCPLPTYGFDQGWILGSFVANATKENKVICCNSTSWPWNGKSCGAQKIWKWRSPSQKKKKKAKGSAPFSYKSFFYWPCFPPLLFYGSVLLYILKSSFCIQIYPLDMFGFES